MANSTIKQWLRYWQAANLVAVDEIRSFQDVYQARKYCSVMRDGVFAEVSDLQIWNALKEMRVALAEAA
jgi:nitroimidazol reductase NimA-like FMN-containing flavoprotein (pyridoxamine 5'-phosphate oxidase superfamily)